MVPPCGVGCAGFGIQGYFTNPLNLFDASIVVLSLLDIGMTGTTPPTITILALRLWDDGLRMFYSHYTLLSSDGYNPRVFQLCSFAEHDTAHRILLRRGILPAGVCVPVVPAPASAKAGQVRSVVEDSACDGGGQRQRRGIPYTTPLLVRVHYRGVRHARWVPWPWKRRGSDEFSCRQSCLPSVCACSLKSGYPCHGGSYFHSGRSAVGGYGRCMRQGMCL